MSFPYKSAALLAVIAVSAVVFSACTGSGEQASNTTSSSLSGSNTQITSGIDKQRVELMNSNDPSVKKLQVATADYIGESMTLYGWLMAADYYNYGFTDETKYYSLKLWDDSVADEYQGVYLYIDKTNPGTNAKTLLDTLLESEPLFVKVEATIPSQKYQPTANSFLEVVSWEVVE